LKVGAAELPGDRGRLVVLERDQDDVREVRHLHRRRSLSRDGRARRAAAASGSDDYEREPKEC
jgi:hypothetical protein